MLTREEQFALYMIKRVIDSNFDKTAQFMTIKKVMDENRRVEQAINRFYKHTSESRIWGTISPPKD